MLILFRGLPGTGKTTLIRELSKNADVIVLSRDELRKKMFKKPRYSETEKDHIDKIIYSAAHSYLHAGANVIIDGMCFTTREKLDVFVHLAVTYAFPWRLVECDCASETAVKRIQQDNAKTKHPAQDRTADLYWQLRENFETVPYPKLQVDTELPIENNVAKCQQYFGWKNGSAATEYESSISHHVVQ